MASKFLTDIQRKIDEINISVKEGYFSLFELISNSIYSINSSKIKNGQIKIILKSNPSQLITDNKFDIQNIEVIDNGIGFNETNFNSFLTCYSSLKKNDGGKGVGRFTCLKVFDYASIKSIYSEKGKNKIRKFDFYPKIELENEMVGETTDNENYTSVELKNIKYSYKESFPTDLNVLAELIIEHFFIYFVTNKIPSIVLERTDGKNLIVTDYYKNSNDFSIKKEEMLISKTKFTLYHVKDTKINKGNGLYLCSNTRNVKKIDLRSHIPNLQSNIGEIKGKKLWYFAYLTSEYLDQIVNQERTEFNFPKEDNFSNEIFDEITYDTLIDKIVCAINNYLAKDIEKIDIEKRKKIDDFIDKNEPQFRQIRKHYPNFYDSIPSNATESKIKAELYKAQAKWEEDTEKEGEKLFNEKCGHSEEWEKRMNDYYQNLNGINKTYLVKYVCKRKAIIDIFSNSLRQRGDNKYNLEKTIHKLICPMNSTSDELNFDDMNLWLIDERLSYHYYLASDVPLNKQSTMKINSEDRPDLVIYNRSLAFNDTPKNIPYSSLTIIEFKRPMRDDYNSEENPIDQVLDYIKTIRNGTARDKDGRPLTGKLDTIPIYTYIICDLTVSLKKLCDKYEFILTPDGEGYYKYHDVYKSYIEIISFDKLLQDAVKRNKILFDKLNIN